MSRVVPLSQGLVAIVDNADFDLVRRQRWYAVERRNSAGELIGHYAARYAPGNRRVYMHRELLGAPEGLVDHRNRDTLDNRRSNLRSATHAQNSANGTTWAASGFRGVYRRTGGASYQARIKVAGRDLNLGSFNDPHEAARAYDRAAREHFGAFAFQNFPAAEAA